MSIVDAAGRFPTEKERENNRARGRGLLNVRRVQRRNELALFHANMRRAEKLKRTPKWADKEAIRAIYLECRLVSLRTGVDHQVDHTVPLQGKLVSGLHVHYNLKIIPAVDNLKKYNHFES